VNVAGMLDDAARAFPEHPAITWRGRTETYAEFAAHAAALAERFRVAGVARGARVALYLHNRPELLHALYATLSIGAIVVPCNVRSTASEVGFVVGDAGVSLVVTDDDHLDRAAEAAGSERVLSVDAGGEAGTGTRPLTIEPVDAESIAWLFYTSGTTGAPKGAMLSHRALSFMVVSWLADMVPSDECSVTLHAAPLSHGAGFHALATTARAGHHVILDEPSLDAAGALDAMERFGVTDTWVVPTQLVLLTGALETSRRPVPARLGRIVYGGAPITTAALERAVAAFGPVLVQLYGQGESPMTITRLAPSEHTGELLASAGRTRLGMEVRIAGDGDDAVGEILVAGPALMSGYWGRPDATAEALRDGWLYTGDVGRRDPRGYVWVLDRRKDLIISGGSNVYAAEVESVLAEQGRVADVAVVGAPDDLWGERVEAFVVIDGAEPFDEGQLDAACRERLAGYKVPRRYHVVDALPRNAYGKVVKTELRALAASR